MHLLVDDRKMFNVPLLLLDLGSHDMIIGRKWLEHTSALVNAKHRRLVWPADALLPDYVPNREILISRESLVPMPVNRYDQYDADRRDNQLAYNEYRRANGTRSLVSILKKSRT